MDSMVFKYKHHYQQQNQHFNRRITNSSNNNNNSMNQNNTSHNCSISSHNNNNQNSIFILNTASNNILSNNSQLYCSDLNDSNIVSPSSSSPAAPSITSSVWSSASSTMCSPAAHALQKLFNCSSGSSSYKFNHGHYSGIESKTFISKAEILKKKSKFWKYLEGEDNDKNNHRGIDDDAASVNEKRLLAKSLKFKSNWCKSFESDNQNQQDLSELLEYSCSLCDNCRCMDCQIGYFDCEDSDDSNSEYSFHLSAYDEDGDEDEEEQPDTADNENACERQTELKLSREGRNCLQATYENCSSTNGDSQRHSIRKLEVQFEMPLNCTMPFCVCKQQQSHCMKTECCQQCLFSEN